MTDSPLILFDGVCLLCNRSALFIKKRDHKNVFRFAALESDVGKKMIRRFHLEKIAVASFILIEDEKIYLKSTAALRVVKKLSGPIRLLYVFIIVPSFLRNLVYDFIAANRYKWFGKVDKCMITDA